MQKEKKDKHFLKKPTYDGGPKALKAFVKENLKYPEEALKEKVEGSVSIKYSINYKGQVISIKVISSLGHGCDEEATRIVKLLHFEVPKNRKLKVVYQKNITIHFRLPKKKVTKVATNIQYNIISKKEMPASSDKEKKENKGGGSYTYTVTI
jgi:protein TonB